MSFDLGVVLIATFVLLVVGVALTARALRPTDTPRPRLDDDAPLTDPHAATAQLDAVRASWSRRPLPSRTSQTWPPSAPARATASGAHRPVIPAARRPRPEELEAGRHAIDSTTSAMPAYDAPNWRIPPYTR